MSGQNNPIYLVLSSEDLHENEVEILNQLTREFGRSLEGYPESISSVSYTGPEELPEGTKTPELIFAQQILIELIPIVTPWVLSKVDSLVKSFYREGKRVYAKLLVGNREIQVTPKTTSLDLARIKEQVKAIEKFAPGKRYALVIGNSKYQDDHFSDLESPIVDAGRLAEVLGDPNICGFNHVETLIDKSNGIIEQSIERFFRNRQSHDLLLLYFSGHGVRNRAGKLFLAAQDTKQNYLRSTAIAASFVKEIMDESFSKRQILILDCCFGGAMVEGAKSEQIVGQSINSTLAFQTSGYGRIIITASESMQYAFDGQRVEGDIENSAFTHHLIDGLRTGKADADNDGLIAIDELYQYAYRRVVPRQTPNISATNQEGRLFLALNPDPTIRPAQLPEQVTRAMQSEDRVYRLGAVSELVNLLKTSDPSIVMSAEMALRQMTLDDSRSVGEVAQAALNEYLGTPTTKSQQETEAEAPPGTWTHEPPASPPREEKKLDIEEPEEDTEPVMVSPGTGPATLPEKDVPALARKWNWGAFWLTPIWGLKHKTRFTWLFLFPFFPPVPQLIAAIYSGAKGGRWAWENRHWVDEDEFVRVQVKWKRWGFVVGWLLWLSVIGLSGAITGGLSF